MGTRKSLQKTIDELSTSARGTEQFILAHFRLHSLRKAFEEPWSKVAVQPLVTNRHIGWALDMHSLCRHGSAPLSVDGICMGPQMIPPLDDYAPGRTQRNTVLATKLRETLSFWPGLDVVKGDEFDSRKQLDE